MKKWCAAALIPVLSVLFISLSASADVSPDGVWQKIADSSSRSALSADQEPWIKPDVFSLFRLDASALGDVLNRAAAGGGAARTAQADLQLTLPAPDGRFVTIVFTEKPVMAPEMAARYPDIKTYTGHDAGDPATTAAFDWTPAGFHAQVLSTEGAWYIDPYIPGESYASYYKRDYRPNKPFIDAPVIVANGRTSLSGPAPLDVTPMKSDRIRTYRLALGCTAEYARYQCGGVCADKTKPVAAMVSTLSRVNQIYRREMAIEFVLVGNNDKLIYLDPQTQPFTNGNKDRLLEQSQKVLDAEIGDSRYDIGHVISTSSGGVSMLGNVCQTGKKAMAITGLDQPKGDAFDVDFVCHEIGHQFNADHTYNGKLGLCQADQYAPLMAYEPGSGSTIMSYCGQCDDDNNQLYGELTFHSGNFDQIQSYVAGKGSCYTLSAVANTAPEVNAGADVAIPRNTPFTLTGSATGSGPLTYVWEEFDRSGTQAAISEADDGKMPLFRVYRPTPGPTRTFPKMETIASGLADKTEKLPRLARTMNFRLVARDGKGGVAYGNRRVTVDATTGPLRVTAPAAGAIVPSGALSVNWDKANTDQLVGAATVDILLSTDGGYTFDQTLLAKTANNGSATVTVPDIGTERARLMVKASDNVFFAISEGNFKISGTGGTLAVTPNTGLLASGEQGGTFQNNSTLYTLKNTGNADLNWTATKGAASAWLDIAPTTGKLEAGADVTVTVSINAAAARDMARDQYQDTVTFTNTTNGAGTTSRSAVLVVGQLLKDGMIVVEADGLDAWGFTGGPFSPSLKTFTIQNAGMSASSWTAAKTPEWLSLSPLEGTPEAGASQTVTASVNNAVAAGMAAGSYTGTITFSRVLEKGSEILATRPVNLTISDQANTAALILTSPEGMTATGYLGGPFAPAGRTYTLRNIGKTDLAWTATKTADWLTLAPAAGTLAPGASADVAVIINNAAAALTAGSYGDTATFTNTADGAGSTTRTVSLTVSPGAGILSVSAPTPVILSGPRGGPFTPAAGVTCTIANTGPTAIDWIIQSIQSWLDVSPYQGKLEAGASAAVRIKAGDIARALMAGTFKDTLYIMNKTNGMGNTTLDGQITVEAAPAAGPLAVSPAAGYTVSGVRGGPFSPASFAFTLENTGAAPLKWEYLGDVAWSNVPSFSGTLAAGASSTWTMTTNDAANLLSSNSYRGSVYFVDTSNKMTVGRNIALQVRGPGDINGDGTVNLTDTVKSMQVLSGQASTAVRNDFAASGADVNGDKRVGPQEAVFALQNAVGLRSVSSFFAMTSAAFQDKQSIPVKYMENGLSPPLSWRNAPDGTQSFALIVEDPDELPALGSMKNYWIVYDIPANVTGLAEGAGAEGGTKLPTGARHGTTSWDKSNTCYHGMEPTPNTGAHRFIFRLFALSVQNLNPAGATQDKIEAAMNGKILNGGICELRGTASRP